MPVAVNPAVVRAGVLAVRRRSRRRGGFVRGVVIAVCVIAASPILLCLSFLFMAAGQTGDLEPFAPTAMVALPGGALAAAPRALAAYQAAGEACEGVDWALLAAIGSVESGHGTFGGATIDPTTGEATPWIFGPPLDGGPGVQSLPIGPWDGWWGLTGPWQRAVGPMQFLPGTFSASAVDGDGDGVTNPHDIDDAAATAAAYLCDGLGIVDERAAVGRYNHSDAYVQEVVALAASYRAAAAGTVVAVGGDWLCPVAGPVSFTDTWGAPRSGGRTHQGVDMFAATGTPTVAPVGGDVEHYNDSQGGLSWRLWGDDGNYYYGTHLSAFAGPTTGHVGRGTVIGYVGQSGNAASTSPHLHFEIHPNRRPGDPAAPVNPTPTVAAHCSGSGAILTPAGD